MDQVVSVGQNIIAHVGLLQTENGGIRRSNVEGDSRGTYSPAW